MIFLRSTVTKEHFVGQLCLDVTRIATCRLNASPEVARESSARADETADSNARMKNSAE